MDRVKLIMIGSVYFRMYESSVAGIRRRIDNSSCRVFTADTENTINIKSTLFKRNFISK